MDISLINSQSLLHLLSLAEKKEELLQILEAIDAEIVRTLREGVSVDVFEVTTSSLPAIVQPTSAANTPVAAASRKTAGPVKPAKAKKRRGMSPEGRAKMAAMMKARWAARRAGKPAGTPVRAASKPVKTKRSPKKRSARRAAKAAAPAKAAKPAKKG